MAVLYKIIQSTKENKDGKKLYHPRAVHIATIGNAQLANEIAEYSSLTSGDVKNTIDNLVRVMTKHLQASETVNIEGLGSFSLIMRSRGKGAETPDDVSPAQASAHIRFLPSSTRHLNHKVATRALITGVKFVPYQPDGIQTDGSKPDSENEGHGDGEGGLG